MNNRNTRRWLWVVVAGLAVAPAPAQPETAGNLRISGRSAAFLQDAPASDPARMAEHDGNTPEVSSPVPHESQDLPLIGREPSAPAAEVEVTAKKASNTNAAKDDVAQIGRRSIGKGVNFYSLEKEQKLGHELASELERQVRLVDDPVITEYVNRVGQNLVRNSDARVPFTIRVIEDDEINAVALPGGYFYVNSGLIIAADNEAELAGVMAHEIAHVCARHATRNMTKGRIWNLASIPLIMVGGPAGYAVRQVAGLAVPMSFLKFSRDAEREADFLGIEYQYASGYDPGALVQFLEKINSTEGKQKHRFVAKLFSTHPMTEDRIRRAQAEIATILLPRDQYVVTTSEFDEVKSRLAKATIRIKSKDDGKPNRPTLRRRTPQAGDSGNGRNGRNQIDGDRSANHAALQRHFN